MNSEDDGTVLDENGAPETIWGEVPADAQYIAEELRRRESSRTGDKQ